MWRLDGHGQDVAMKRGVAGLHDKVKRDLLKV